MTTSLIEAADLIGQYLADNDPSEFGCACTPDGHICGPCKAHERHQPICKAAYLITAAIEAAKKREKAQGRVVVTTTRVGELVSITRQNDEGQVLSVIWEACESRAEIEAKALEEAANEIGHCWRCKADDTLNGMAADRRVIREARAAIAALAAGGAESGGAE